MSLCSARTVAESLAAFSAARADGSKERPRPVTSGRQTRKRFMGRDEGRNAGVSSATPPVNDQQAYIVQRKDPSFRAAGSPRRTCHLIGDMYTHARQNPGGN